MTDSSKKRRRIKTRPTPDNTVPSPCIGVCAYDGGDVCRGCYRTPDEIREWIIMGREEKLAVLALLADRRAQDKL